MSIVNDLIELNGDKSDIQDALVAKGVTSAGKHGFNKFAEDITSITNQYTSSDEDKVVSNGSLVAQTSTTATTNGTIDTTTNNEVVVNVPNSYTQVDEGKVVQSGSLVAQTSTTVSQNGTVNTTANNQVIVDVPNSYTQSDEGKVVSNGALISQTVYPTTITENGTYDTTTNNSVTVEISSSNNNICAMLYNDSNFSTTSKVSLSVFNNNALTVLVGGYGNVNTKTYYVNPNEILLSNYFLEDDVITGTGYSPTSGTTQATKVTVSCQMKISTNTVVISKSTGGTGSNVYFTCYNY